MPPPRRSSKSVWQVAAFSQTSWRAVGSSIAVHLALALLLFAGLKWQLESPGPLQVELWTEGNTTEIARAPEQPQPEPQPEPSPPPPQDPDVAAREAEIALEKAKEQERAELARLEAEKLAREQAELERRLEQERQARLAAEQRAREEAAKKAEAERKAQEEAAKKAEAERKAQEEAAKKAEAERKAKEEAAKKAEAERKAKEEAAKKVEAERKAKEEAAKKAEAERKAKEEAAKKAEAERKAKEEAAKKAEAERKAKEAAAREKALRDAFRNDIMGATGIAGGSATRNQQGGGADAGYAGQIRACIQPNVSFPTPVRSGNANPTAQFRVQLKSDGTVASTSLRRSSGNASFDRAVDNGIRRCSPFPKPPSGRYPSYIDVNYQMYD